MSREEESYKPGEEAFYHESGEITRVKVLENNSNEDWIKYRLKVLENIRVSKMYKPPKIGEEFNLEKRRNISCSGLGYLLDN